MANNNNDLPENKLAGDDDEKLDITKSVFQVSREMQAQKQAELAEKQREIERQYQEREKQKREAYEKKIREERIELMRLKQGLIEESETIHEEHEKERKLTVWQKIGNFFYHNKWWLGIGTFLTVMIVFLVYNLLSRPDPDMIVLVLCDNDSIGNSSQFETYLETFADDFNENDEVMVSTYYIPYKDNAYVNYQSGVDTKLTTELQSADAVIVLGGDNINEMLAPDQTLVDLSEYFPDDPHIKGYGYYLKDTDFAEKLGIDPELVTDDLYLGLRKPRDLLYSSKEDLQKTFDRDIVVFEKLINDLSAE